jgi:hypothetical protein
MTDRPKKLSYPDDLETNENKIVKTVDVKKMKAGKE